MRAISGWELIDSFEFIRYQKCVWILIAFENHYAMDRISSALNCEQKKSIWIGIDSLAIFIALVKCGTNKLLFINRLTDVVIRSQRQISPLSYSISGVLHAWWFHWINYYSKINGIQLFDGPLGEQWTMNNVTIHSLRFRYTHSILYTHIEHTSRRHRKF